MSFVTSSNLSSTWSGEFTVASIISMAWQKARMMNVRSEPDEQEQAWSRKWLNVQLDAIQAEGKIIRAVEMEEVDITAGTATYTLSDEIIDVEGDAMLIRDDDETETIVRYMPRSEWQVISNKDSQGHPSRYYPEKLATITVKLWPVPDFDATLRLQAVRLLRDVTATNQTLDFERHWIRYVITDLAYEVAMANGQDLAFCQMLKSEAETLKTLSRGHAKQRGPIQMVSMHRTGWNR